VRSLWSGRTRILDEDQVEDEASCTTVPVDERVHTLELVVKSGQLLNQWTSEILTSVDLIAGSTDIFDYLDLHDWWRRDAVPHPIPESWPCGGPAGLHRLSGACRRASLLAPELVRTPIVLRQRNRVPDARCRPRSPGLPSDWATLRTAGSVRPAPLPAGRRQSPDSDVPYQPPQAPTPCRCIVRRAHHEKLIQ
jgi:hypothetical protein